MPYVTGTYSYSPNGGAYTATTSLFDNPPTDTTSGVSAWSNVVSTVSGGCELIVTDYVSLTALVDFGGRYALDAMYYGVTLPLSATHGSIGFCGGGTTGWASYPIIAFDTVPGLTAQYSLDGVNWTHLTGGIAPNGAAETNYQAALTAGISPPITAGFARLIGSVRAGTWIVVGTLSGALKFTDFRFTGLTATASCINITATAQVTASLSCCGKSQSVSWAAVDQAATYSLYHRVPALGGGYEAVLTGTTQTTYAYSVPPAYRPYANEWAVVPTNDCGNGPTGTALVGPLYAPGVCGDATYTAPVCTSATYAAPDCD